MTNLIDSCAECYEITLPECAETISLQAGLDANQYYWYQLENRFGQKFTDRVETDENGYLTIDLTRFANHVALFSHTAGTFTLSVGNNLSQPCGETPLNLCERQYSCVKIAFERVFSVSDELLAAVIPCECAEEDRGGEVPPPPPPLGDEGILNVAIGDSALPNGLGVYDFGEVVVGEQILVNLKMTNTGGYGIELIGTPTVLKITGDDSNQFGLGGLVPTGSIVWAGVPPTGSEIVFMPTDIGLKKAIISIPIRAPYDGLYTFAVMGTGI